MAANSHQQSTIHVLQVDEDIDSETTKKMMEQVDGQIIIEVESSPSMAIKIIEKKGFDCILLDYKMDEMNGVELTKRIKKISTTPIIIYTGKGSENVAEEAFAVGADDYIRKDTGIAHYQVLANRIRHAVSKKSTEERYRTLLNTMVEGFQVIGFDWRYKYLNDSAIEHAGKPRNLLLEKTMMESFPGIENTEMFAALKRCMEQRIPQRLDNHFTYPDKTSRWFELRVQPRPEGISVLSLDINERKKAEETLIESETRCRILLESLTDAVFVLDEETYLYANEGAAKMLGYASPDAIIGQPSFSLVAPEDRERVRNMTAARVKGEEVAARYHMQLLRKNGGIVPVDVNVSKITYKGRIASLGVHRDITEQLKMDEALKESEEQYRMLVENSPNAIFVTVGNKIVYANKSRAELAGVDDPSKLIGVDVISHVADSEKDLYLIHYAAIRMSETPLSQFAYNMVRLDGSVRNVIEYTLKIAFKGEEAIQHMIIDTTEQRHYEDRLEALHKNGIALARAENIPEIAELTLDTIISTLGFERCGFGVIEDGWLKFKYYRGIPGVTDLRIDGKGVTTRAVRTGETQFVPDIREDKDYVIAVPTNGYKALSEIAVPIKVDGVVTVVLNVENKGLNAYTRRDQRLLEILAEQVASTYKGIQEKEKRRKYEARLEALSSHASKLVVCEDLTQIAEITIDAIYSVMEADHGSFGVVMDGELGFIRIIGSQKRWETELPLNGPGVTVKAVNSGEVQLIDDTSLEKIYIGSLDADVTYLSELAVPVKVNGIVKAVINLESRKRSAFSVDDVKLVELFCEHVVSALQRINVEEAQKRYRRRLEELYALATHLDEVTTINEASRIVATAVHRLFSTDYAHVSMVEGNELVSASTESNISSKTKLKLSGKGVTVKSVAEKATILVPDTRREPDYIEVDSNVLSELAVPLIVEGTVVGVLNLEATRLDAYNEDDVKLVEMLARNLSSTIHRIHINDKQRIAHEKALLEETAAEKARELSAAKTRFLSLATHEIRTPLTSILGYTELIQGALDSGDTSRLETYFNAVMRNAERLTRLTDDLLDNQRIDERKLTVKKARIHVDEVLSELRLQAAPELMRKRQTLNIKGDVDAAIYADKDRIIQVVANLVGNASKFSPDGSPIHLSVEKRRGEVIFAVRDCGVGLEEADIPKLFQPFPGIRVQGNRESTGLGLSICRGIVEIHGGRIWAESGGPGKGSVFSFVIPEAS